MHGDNVFKILNVVVLWFGIWFLISGAQTMYNSGYTSPPIPSGWLMGMFWIIGGCVVSICWITFVVGHLVGQKCMNKPRWSTTKILTTGVFLIVAAGFGITGTYLTWRHPFRLGPCPCRENEWGPLCTPCRCTEHGLCDDGEYGSGRCSCDLGWAGDFCQICDDRWKPEGQCDICKTGYEGDKCQFCAVGYTGEECDICDRGWHPWQYKSDLFPDVLAADDNRHLCNECLPNHYGYYCKQCPYGRDVPHITLDRNEPIVQGTRLADQAGLAGELYDMQIRKNGEWINSYNYESQNPQVLIDTRIKIKYDITNKVSDWIAFQDIKGIQCNNRGVCMDDVKHQELNPNWKDKCTWENYAACTTNNDCKVSQNCKGECKGVDLPISSLWAVKFDGNLCQTDEDCIDRTLFINELNETYEGGRCVNRGCCDQTFHGDGTCICDKKFFGTFEEGPSAPTPQYLKSPGCDFCPGYDWITEVGSTICSGKGTCNPDYSRTGDYIGMKCSCGEFSFIDPETKIVDPNKDWVHSGDLCQCGDLSINGKLDGKCDMCTDGYWGPTCQQCPGGPGQRQCSGHGKCDQGIFGTGQCFCSINDDSSWMLAPYVKRYPSESVGLNNKNEDLTCSECAPNFFGDKCLRCPETAQITPTQFNEIFQPAGSYQFGQGQTSSEPQTLCHPQQPWVCSFACGRGGWCNWGRQGDGTCQCWENKRLNSMTWNPLDNVCIGNDRYEPDSQTPFDGTQEKCSTYGYCSQGDRSRDTSDTCGNEESDWLNIQKDMTVPGRGWLAYDDWKDRSYDNDCPGTDNVCYKWLPISFGPKYGITCMKKEA